MEQCFEELVLKTLNPTGALRSLTGRKRVALLGVSGLQAAAAHASGGEQDGCTRAPNSLLVPAGGRTQTARQNACGVVGVGLLAVAATGAADSARASSSRGLTWCSISL